MKNIKNVKNEIMENMPCVLIWGFGSIKIEFGMSKSLCMQSMSFVGARSIDLSHFVRAWDGRARFSITLITNSLMEGSFTVFVCPFE